MGSTMRPGGADLFALIVVILRVLLVQVPGSGQAISAGHTDFRGDLPEELEVVRVAAPMVGPSRRSDRHRVSVGARVDGMPRAMDLFVLVVRLFPWSTYGRPPRIGWTRLTPSELPDPDRDP